MKNAKNGREERSEHPGTPLRSIIRQVNNLECRLYAYVLYCFMPCSVFVVRKPLSGGHFIVSGNLAVNVMPSPG